VATRLGISISQKVSKKAVVRNRLKRQIRAAFWELLPRMAPGWKVVVVVRPEATECKYEHFLRELEQLFKKAEIINGY
jgi:ribonuclease P protein component